MTVIGGIAQDLRHATRRLVATPLFTACAVLSLAVGVAVTTAGYSIISMLFFMDLGIPDPESAAFVVRPSNGEMLRGSLSSPDFDDLRAAQTSFARIAASTAFHTPPRSPPPPKR